MKQERRTFLKRIPVLATTALTIPLNSALGKTEKRPPIDFSNLPSGDTEKLWEKVREAFPHTPNIINLNNGAVSPHPIAVQQAFENAHLKHNLLPAKHLITQAAEKREVVREQLAQMAGCSSNEIALTRNATEALTTIIKGIPLEKGDEIVVSSYDYPHTLNAWKQRAAREGLVLKWVDLYLPADENAIIESYQKAMTERTKMVMVTHMISWNGQLMPVKNIVAIAKSKALK